LHKGEWERTHTAKSRGERERKISILCGATSQTEKDEEGFTRESEGWGRHNGRRGGRVGKGGTGGEGNKSPETRNVSTNDNEPPSATMTPGKAVYQTIPENKVGRSE